MTKDLLTQDAQKEAEGLKPYRVEQFPGTGTWNSRVVGPDMKGQFLTKGDAEQLCDALNAAYAAAHVKCALLYSERAAGQNNLVAVAEKLRDAAQYAVEHMEPLLADADLDSGRNPAWLSVHGMKSAIASLFRRPSRLQLSDMSRAITKDRTTLAVVADYLKAEQRHDTGPVEGRRYWKSRMQEFAEEFDDHLAAAIRRNTPIYSTDLEP